MPDEQLKKFEDFFDNQITQFEEMNKDLKEYNNEDRYWNTFKGFIKLYTDMSRSGEITKFLDSIFKQAKEVKLFGLNGDFEKYCDNLNSLLDETLLKIDAEIKIKQDYEWIRIINTPLIDIKSKLKHSDLYYMIFYRLTKFINYFNSTFDLPKLNKSNIDDAKMELTDEESELVRYLKRKPNYTYFIIGKKLDIGTDAVKKRVSKLKKRLKIKFTQNALREYFRDNY